MEGEPKYHYPWGDDADPQKANFNFDKSRKFSWEYAKKYLKDVGSYAPNGYGLYDMAGNVLEWCADLFDKYYYRQFVSKITNNPQVPSSGEYRVLRGGSWYNDPNGLRCAIRLRNDPDITNPSLGFRCVQDAADALRVYYSY